MYQAHSQCKAFVCRTLPHTWAEMSLAQARQVYSAGVIVWNSWILTCPAWLWAGTVEHRFDCVVVDPPWENASAKRAAKYGTLPSRHLLSVPMRKLLNPVRPLVAEFGGDRA